ncbi:hypothetical protein HKX48_005201 [Thoreauomyces humboldtii]|nr:hypothetical protein HKX48_005201 [Thoreauomyces humboldtii]
MTPRRPTSRLQTGFSALDDADIAERENLTPAEYRRSFSRTAGLGSRGLGSTLETTTAERQRHHQAAIDPMYIASSQRHGKRINSSGVKLETVRATFDEEAVTDLGLQSDGRDAERRRIEKAATAFTECSKTETTSRVRESNMQILPPTPVIPGRSDVGMRPLRKIPIVGRVPEGTLAAEGYFRVFTEMKTIETVTVAKNGHHLAALLPHRYTKKMPLYGTSPRMLMMMQQAPPSRMAAKTPRPIPPIPKKERAPFVVPPLPKRKGGRRQSVLKPVVAAAEEKISSTTVPSPQKSVSNSKQPKKRIKRGKSKVADSPPALSESASSTPGSSKEGEEDTEEESARKSLEGLAAAENQTAADVAAASLAASTNNLESNLIEEVIDTGQTGQTDLAMLDSAATDAAAGAASFVPYKARRPTPPRVVSTNLSAVLGRKDGAGEDDGEGDGGDDTIGGLGGHANPVTPQQKSKFTGRNRGGSVGGGWTEEGAKKRRASFQPGLKKYGANAKKIDMDSLRKRRESNAAPHRSGLENADEPGHEDFLSSLVKDMNVMDEDSKLRYIRMSEPIFKDNDLISIETLGAELTRMKWITEGEVDYITKVFELVAGDYVDQSEFCVIAALAERMTFLDTSLRQSFGDTDFRKLESNIKQYRHLFTVNTNEDGKMTYDDLKILLLSTGLPANSIEGVAALLNLSPAGKDGKQSEVGFLDFLSYVPFFALLHDRIVDDPLGYNAGDENAAGGEDVVKKLMADLKARQEK